uniref:Uncharacterized protein n=1 Tax=Hyaloperonospora arabidopsidis (strain Emoy2) TaxID=559515 RepID=M4C3W3_HYAAE
GFLRRKLLLKSASKSIAMASSSARRPISATLRRKRRASAFVDWASRSLCKARSARMCSGCWAS